MIFKQGDVVKSREKDNKSEALVDLVIGDTVYITPRGKMSLSYPERYLISKSKLIKCDNSGKYIFTKEQISKDWYALTGEIIYEFNDLQIDSLKKGDIIKYKGNTYVFVEMVDGMGVFNYNGYVYSFDQEELNALSHNDKAIVQRLYGSDITNFEIIDEDEEPKQEIKVPQEVQLPF